MLPGTRREKVSTLPHHTRTIVWAKFGEMAMGPGGLCFESVHNFEEGQGEEQRLATWQAEEDTGTETMSEGQPLHLIRWQNGGNCVY